MEENLNKRGEILMFLGKLKKIFLIIVGTSLIVGGPSALYGKNTQTKLFLNGRERWDTEIVILEDTTYVPLRIVGEALGATVTYDSIEKSVILTKDNQGLQVRVGEIEAVLNGEKFSLTRPMILHTNEENLQLTYIPLRTIFETFDGVVDYNKGYNYINAYNKEHISYEALKGLKSDDLTTYRFAQLALPRTGQEGMAVRGGRVVSYIFPLNKKTNYFFLRTDPSGDMDISTMAYMEIENGVAVCKWYKEVRGDKEENINPQDNAINRNLGARGIVEEIGEFPNIEETNFISFTRHNMIQPEGSEQLASYKDTFNKMISILTLVGAKDVAPALIIGDLIRSPYISEYKVSYKNDSTSYSYYYNDDLLSRIDEGKVSIK